MKAAHQAATRQPTLAALQEKLNAKEPDGAQLHAGG